MQLEVKPKLKYIKKEEILSPWKIIRKRLKKNKLAMAGMYILLFMVLMSIIGPIISPYKMETIDLYNVSASPTFKHLLGTDDVGRDVLTRVMYGGRISLAVGVLAVLVEVY